MPLRFMERACNRAFHQRRGELLIPYRGLLNSAVSFHRDILGIQQTFDDYATRRR